MYREFKDRMQNKPELYMAELESLMKSANLIFILDLDARITRYYAAKPEKLYTKPENFLGKTVFDVMPPYTHNPFARAFETCKKGKISHFEYMLEISGENRWFKATLIPVFIDDRLVEVIVSVNDITEERKREFILKEVFENAEEGIIIVDYSGTILEWNKAAEKIIEIGREEVLGRKIWDVAFELLPKEKKNKDLRQRMKQSILEFLRTGNAFWAKVLYEVEMDVKSGRKIFEILTVPIESEKGYMAAIFVRDITEKRKQDEAYRTIVDNSIQGLLIFQEGKVVFANPAAEVITGYRLQELSEDDVKKIVHIEDRDRVWRLAQEKIAGKEIPERIELRVIRKDGKTIWVECLIKPVKFLGKNAVVAAFIDITERKEFEKKLRIYRKIFENSINGISIIDKNGYWIEQNEAHRRLLGFSDEEMKGKSPAIYMGEKQFQEILRKLKKEGVFRGEVVCKRKDGSEIHVELSAFPIRDDKGEIIYYAGIKRDITSHKMLLKKLKESEEKFRLIVENVNDVIITVDTDGKITYISPSSEKVLGYKPEERLGKSIFDNIHPDDVEWAKKEFLRLARYPKTAKTLVRCRRRDGKYIWVEVSGSPILENGEAVLGVMVLRDVTERVRLQNLLKVINSIGKAAVMEKNLEKYLDRVCEEFITLPECAKATICLIEDGKFISFFGGRSVPEKLSTCKLIIEVVEKGHHMYQSSEECRGCAEKMEFNWVYSFPMQVDNRIRGVLVLYLEQKLSREEEELIQTLADDLALTIKAFELEEEKRRAYMQIEDNIEKFAILIDGIKNPLAALSGFIETRVYDREVADKLMEQVKRIQELTYKLERGWLESEKIREFLRKHM
jgi:PAS domain S-box-containing protein